MSSVISRLPHCFAFENRQRVKTKHQLSSLYVTSAWVFLFWPVSIHFVSPCSVPPTSPFVFGSNPFVRLPFLIESVGGCVFLDTKGVCFKPFLWFVLCFASFPACDLRPSGSVFCRNVTSFYNSKCKTLRVGQNIRLCAAALGSLQVVVLSVKCPWINKKSKRLKNICFISSDDS